MASSISKGARRPAPAHNNFLEALRDLGKGVASDVSQSFGIYNSAESIEQKSDTRPATTQFHQERLLFLRQEEDTKKQIQAIQQEIHALAKSTSDLAKEVQVATFQAPANPGIYHKNFFEALRSFIKSLRQKIEQSRHWLATSNARASKRSHYWGQVSRSGTKFMLSQERYMVTSTG